MKTKKVDGRLFAMMLKNGMASLQAVEKQLNAMNVFPVADGDTGTNMLTTLRNGVKPAPDTDDLSEYLRALSGGMLLGARGNSGVILSQIFKGIYLELSKRSVATPTDLRNAFIRGYKVAYEAVIHPQEGTILTVCREGIEHVTHQMKHIPDVETLLRSYLSYMEISLAKTPELLPVLAEMEVVDSGGKGYIALINGMADALDGIYHTISDEAQSNYAGYAPQPDFNSFGADSSFDEGYCMEFILQLLNSAPYLQNFDERTFISRLEERGNSLVVVRDGSRVKVHVHTKSPAGIISYAQEFGEFLTFKLENMQLQHNELIGKAAVPAIDRIAFASPAPNTLATIAAVNGTGLKETFKDLGCDRIIECGPTMNASTEEFISAILAVNAEHTVILPGNPNLILAANQAADMTGRDIRVLDSKTIPETYFALAMDIRDSEDYEMRIEQMRSGYQSVETLLVAAAAKSFSHNGISFPEHRWVAICRNEPILSAGNVAEAVIEGIRRIKGIKDKEICLLIRGKNGLESDGAAIQEQLEQMFPMMEYTVIDGGQQIYDWMVGLA